MNKHERMTAFVADLGADPALALHPCYQGYFRLFNEGRYYEAHDVLEHLWLGPRDENFAFYKGLIQIAGAFVHLQKQFLQPEHPKHSTRLRPAVRLFALGTANLAAYRPAHLGLDVDALRDLCTRYAAGIADSGFTRNPWTPGNGPRIVLRTAA